MSADFQPGMEPPGNRPLLYNVKKPTERADSDIQKKNFLSCHRRNG